MKELPWEKIKEMNEQKKSELTFEKEPEVIPDEKPFWEVDDHAGSPEVKPEVKKLDNMSWEEPEHIIHDTNQGPPPVYNTTALAKLVHLDFKGAPLKMYFIEKFIQNITMWGGTGLLMEYEDTFPFSNRFSVLKGKFTYTEDFIKKLNSQAKQNNLEVIPYISLFDDLGFLLKHTEFKKYRDNSKYTELINPLHDDSGLCSISFAWAKGGIDVGNPMLKIGKCCEGDRAPPTPQKSENKFRVIWLSMIKDSHRRILPIP